MANNLNLLVMQANVTKDPECKDINGQRLCNLTLACNREYKDKKETCFIDAQCWGGLNKVVEQYVKKGTPVLVEGRIQLDSWTSKEGEKRYKHVIVINNLTMLPKGSKSEKEPEEENKNNPYDDADLF